MGTGFKDNPVFTITPENHENDTVAREQTLPQDQMDEKLNPTDDHKRDSSDTANTGNNKRLLYTIDETPPWYLCVILGFQHYITALGGLITMPLLYAKPLCMEGDNVGLGELISTVFFVSGLGTMIQSTLGVRLPIIQGATIAFLAPTYVLMAQPQWKCPYDDGQNTTDLPELGSEEHKQMWKARLCEVQGSLIVAALFQVAIGYGGLLGPILKYVGPLSIAPTISLIGLSVFGVIAEVAAKQWYIALMTMFFITLFSQYTGKVMIPICKYERGTGCKFYKFPIFKLFPILLAVLCSWGVCAILTATNVLPAETYKWGYHARTDIKLKVLDDSQWFRFPYPGQWGTPTVSVAGVFGMLAGVLASMVESVGDYYACARLAGAPPPPYYAINRGSGTEGLILILSGSWGTGAGLTSYSENVGAIGLTKVGSRRVVQTGGLIMVLLGCLGKFGALFVTIPEPVIGGVLFITIGMVSSVGMSNFQFIDMASSRNIFIIGTSFFFGLGFPLWMKDHPDSIKTGSDTVDHILSVLLSTSMFVGGITGFLLDNTIPGTEEERGLRKWRSTSEDSGHDDEHIHDSVYDTYRLPLIDKYLSFPSVARFLPFCSSFRMSDYCACLRICKKYQKTSQDDLDDVKISKYNKTLQD